MNVTRLSSCSYANAPRRSNCGTVGRPARTAEERYDVGDGCDSYVPSNLAESPIQPPWRVLPWPHASTTVAARKVAVAAGVKSAVGRADLTSVGRTLDVFV